MEEKGWTITYISCDDCKKWVAGRFKTTKERNDFLEKVRSEDSGWTPEELNSICVINDYNY